MRRLLLFSIVTVLVASCVAVPRIKNFQRPSEPTVTSDSGNDTEIAGIAGPSEPEAIALVAAGPPTRKASTVDEVCADT